MMTTREPPRVALVTGSSQGLGRVIATRLAADGLAIAVNSSHDEQAVLDVVRGIRGDGGIADGFVADVTDPDSVAGLAAAVEERLGRVGVLVLNATGPQPDAPVLDVTWQDHLDQLAFFVKSPVLLAGRVVPGMRAGGWGRIVHVDSEVADRPPPGRSAYATAKSAQLGLMRSWAHELAPDGITVNAVGPGFIPVERHSAVPQATRDAYRATVPVGRMGVPDDVAAVVSFLVSDDASFVTGQRILVDGGRSLFV